MNLTKENFKDYAIDLSLTSNIQSGEIVKHQVHYRETDGFPVFNITIVNVFGKPLRKKERI